eukprot:3146685-Rhodomonas_salina.7
MEHAAAPWLWNVRYRHRVAPSAALATESPQLHNLRACYGKSGTERAFAATAPNHRKESVFPV